MAISILKVKLKELNLRKPKLFFDSNLINERFK